MDDEIVSLFVRLWVEMSTVKDRRTGASCQPLREAVSWNISCQMRLYPEDCQPLREAVSWNNNMDPAMQKNIVSASSWGCELKCWKRISLRRSIPVSLFVRLWVEIPWNRWRISKAKRQPLREAVSWNLNVVNVHHVCDVSLFVRLWVEIDWKIKNASMQFVSLFVRLWVEIIMLRLLLKPETGQPLREAVSWNILKGGLYRL